MLGLKTFVRVQTFWWKPFVQSHNFYHPAYYDGCQKVQSRIEIMSDFDTILSTDLADCENSLYVNIDKDLHKASHLQGWWWFVLQDFSRIKILHF